MTDVCASECQAGPDEALSAEWWQGPGAGRAALHPGWRWRWLGEVRGGGGWTKVSTLVISSGPRAL